MKFRTLANAVVASVLTIGVAFAVGSPASASVTQVVPVPGSYSEIVSFSYVSPKCLDVPFASRTDGQALQTYQCHGYASNGANQLWQFVFTNVDEDTGFNVYHVVNKNSGLCLTMYFDITTPLIQSNCADPLGYNRWSLVSPLGSGRFVLESYLFPADCAALADTSGQDGTAVVGDSCGGAGVFRTTWTLG